MINLAKSLFITLFCLFLLLSTPIRAEVIVETLKGRISFIGVSEGRGCWLIMNHYRREGVIHHEMKVRPEGTLLTYPLTSGRQVSIFTPHAGMQFYSADNPPSSKGLGPSILSSAKSSKNRIENCVRIY